MKHFPHKPVTALIKSLVESVFFSFYDSVAMVMSPAKMLARMKLEHRHFHTCVSKHLGSKLKHNVNSACIKNDKQSTIELH